MNEAGTRVKSKSVYIIALMDQVIFGASASLNFIVLENLILRDTYALLATLYSFIVLYQMVSSAMFMDAFAINLPYVGMEHSQRYFVYTVRLFLLFSLVVGSAILGAYLLYFGLTVSSVWAALVFLATAVSFSLMMFARRLCYSMHSVVDALFGSIAYITLYAIALAIGYFQSILGLGYIFISLGAAALASFLLVSLRLRVLRSNVARAGTGFDRSRVGDYHRKYARMGFLTGALKWIPDNLLFSLLGIWSTLDHVATYRMATNLVMPFRYIVVALVNVMLPMYSRLAASGRSAEGWRHAVRFMFGFVAVSSAMFVLFWFLGESILKLLYRSDIEPVLNVILVLSLVPVLSAAQAFAGVFLKSTGHISYVAIQSVVGALVTVSLGSLLIMHFGAEGAAFALVTSMLSMSALGIAFVFYCQRRA